MVIIAFANYPLESAREMENRLIKLSPTPEFITMEGPFIYSNGNGGVQAATLFKFDKSRMSEALRFANDRHAEFFCVVNGYAYNIKVCAEAEKGS